jgi:NADPH-dependent ferric siderophore reductase
MSDDGTGDLLARVRREPPPFRRVAVASIDDLTPHMRRVVLAGPELDGFTIDAPGSSVRLLLPPRGADTIVMPRWTGNQFELPNGARAPIRTFTPRRYDGHHHRLTIDVVLHERGAASDWVGGAQPGDETAISGPGRGYAIDATATTYLVAGDETAIPAISQLLEALPQDTSVDVHIEIAHPDARLELPEHPHTAVTWHEREPGRVPGDALVAAIESMQRPADAMWVAGEAASMQRIRTHLFERLGLPRSAATVRGYWKHGRAATE